MSNRFEQILNKALEAPHNIPVRDLAGMLVCDVPGFDESLFAAAREVKAKYGKTEVLPRGLIETSNVCAKDCLYCGIRKSNAKVARYRLDKAKVLDCVREAIRRGYPAVAFQSGEIENEANTAFYERLLKGIGDIPFSRDRNVASPLALQRKGDATFLSREAKHATASKGDATFLSREKKPSTTSLEVTLSLGEQTEEVYRRWKVAAGDRILRYLIRIETSNRNLYARIHPKGCSFDRRLDCIRTLKRLGYVTGSGVMIGLPGQTVEDLANDIVFFGEEQLDMVGMGPYIPDPATPMGIHVDATSRRVREENVHLALVLRMIALTRLYMHDINIVAATALEALDPARGRERGIAAGANVVMPVLTPVEVKAAYTLYPGKAEAR